MAVSIRVRAACTAALLLAAGLATPGRGSAAAVVRTVGAGDWASPAGELSGSFDNPAETTITAANASTLGQAWASYPGSPYDVPFIEAGGLLIFANRDASSIEARDANTGSVVWSIPNTGYGTVVAHGSTVLFPSTHLSPGGNVLGLQAVDLTTGHLKWFAPARDPSSSLFLGDVLPVGGVDVISFVTSNAISIVGFDEVTGSTRWSTRAVLSQGLGYTNGVLLASLKNIGYVALNPLTGRVVSTPPGLYAVGGRRSSTIGSVRIGPCPPAPVQCPQNWTIPVTGFVSSVAQAGTHVVATVASTSTQIPSEAKIIDARTGREEWSIPGSFSHATIAGSLIYLTGGSGQTVALTTWSLNGCGASICTTPIFNYRFPQYFGGSTVSPAVVAHGHVYVSVSEAGLVALALDTRVPAFQGIPGSASGVSAVSWAPGRIDLFAVDMQSRLNHRVWLASKGWFKWEVLGGTDLLGTPRVASWSAGRLDVFVRATGGRLEHIAWNGAWSKFEVLATDPAMMDAPAVASRGAGQLDVFWIGGPGSGTTTLKQLSWTGVWRPVQTLPIPFYGGLSVASTGSNGLEVFGLDVNGVIAQAGFRAGNWTASSEVPGGLGALGGSTVVAGAGGRLDLFTIGSPHGGLVHAVFDGRSWSIADVRSGNYQLGPGGTSPSPGRIDVFSIESDYAMQQDVYWPGWISHYEP